MPVVQDPEFQADESVPLLIVGAGACGLTAALSARELGCQPLILECDSSPSGSTALSSGMIPACGSRAQRDAGIADDVALMAADIQRKASGEVDPMVLAAVCGESGPTVDWLSSRHAIELELVQGFLYPGHSVPRMHAPPTLTGESLMAALLRAISEQGIDLLTGARVETLVTDARQRVVGVRLQRPDGSSEQVGCDCLLLACNGYGGNPDMVKQHIPEMADALYFGHPGNRGEAVLWGRELGARTRHLSACQGHGSVATPHNILVTWAIMMAGGIQVNCHGQRFSNEHRGYSEQAQAVLAQPGHVAWNIYDQRLHNLASDFADYRDAQRAGAIRTSDGLESLAAALGLPGAALRSTLTQVGELARAKGADAFGRRFRAEQRLTAPYYGVKVTGALFHTQGGLAIDDRGRVLLEDGTALPNLLAAGGAACGLSGSSIGGYLSGNGLLSALVLGRIAGKTGATLALGRASAV